MYMEEEEDVSEQSDDSLEDPLLTKKENPNLTVGDVIEQARQQALKGSSLEDKLNKMLICCGCLGDRSDDVNEIVECDGCGVSVHEGTNFKYLNFYLNLIYLYFNNNLFINIH